MTGVSATSKAGSYAGTVQEKAIIYRSTQSNPRGFNFVARHAQQGFLERYAQPRTLTEFLTLCLTKSI